MVDRGRQRNYHGHSFVHRIIITMVCKQYTKLKLPKLYFYKKLFCMYIDT